MSSPRWKQPEQGHGPPPGHPGRQAWEQKPQACWGKRLHWPPESYGGEGREAAAQPSSASMSQHAWAGQVAMDMPDSGGRGRTFLGTFRLSRLSCPCPKGHR